MFKKLLKYSYGHLISLCGSLLVVPLIGWLFSKNEISIYYLSLAVVNIGTLVFSWGLDQVLLRRNGDICDRSKYVNDAFNFTLGSFVLFIIIAYIFLGEKVHEVMGGVLNSVLVCLIVLIGSVQRLQIAVLKISGDGAGISNILSLQKISFLVLVFFMSTLNISRELNPIVFAFMISSFITSILEFYTVSKYVKYNLIKFRPLKKSNIDIKAGFYLSLGSIFFSMLPFSERFLLKEMIGNQAVAIFSIGVSLANVGMVAGNVFLSMWLPEVYKSKDGMVIIPFCKGLRSRNATQPWPVAALV